MTISVEDYDGVYNKKIATEDVLFSGKNIYDDLLAAVLELADKQNPNWRDAKFQLNHYDKMQRSQDLSPFFKNFAIL